ncbi:MAG: hypothetical protein KC620_01130 [Myxococcales bacterium]|nr:hypothetical protein [Myxococcales bacterium]
MRPPLWLLAAALSLGCGAGRTRVDTSGYPPDQQANYQIFETRCSRCHDLERPLQARVADGGWDAYVRRMARHPGAGISEAEQRRIASFLEFHHRETER